MSIPTTYDIEHKCGHEETRDLSDVPAGQRAGKVEWLKTRPCFECFRASGKLKVSKQLKSEWDQQHQEAIADQERPGLPLLRGSDKQVKWAIDCRYKLLRDGYDALVQEGELDDADFDAQVLEPARRIDLAKWWIDNRESTTACSSSCSRIRASKPVQTRTPTDPHRPLQGTLTASCSGTGTPSNSALIRSVGALEALRSSWLMRGQGTRRKGPQSGGPEGDSSWHCSRRSSSPSSRLLRGGIRFRLRLLRSAERTLGSGRLSAHGLTERCRSGVEPDRASCSEPAGSKAPPP